MRVLALMFLLVGCEDKPSDNTTTPAEGNAEVTVPATTENTETTSQSVTLPGTVQDDESANQKTNTQTNEGEVNNDND